MAISISKAVAAAVATLAFAGAAHAGTYELTFTGDGISGDIFATTTGSGAQQTVTSIWGSLTDADAGAGTFNVTGLSSYAGASNFYYTTSPFVDFGGISFSTDAGGDFNLGLGGSNTTGQVLNTALLNPGGWAGVAGSDNIEMTSVAVVPEPANVMMMLAGVVGLVGLSRRRAAR